MKKKNIAGVILLTGLLVAGSLVAAESDPESEYRLTVMKILKLHMSAIETLATNPSLPYAENMVRHATAMQSTTQLLDHVYPTDAQAKQRVTGRPWTDKASFEKMVANSQKATIALVETAKAWQQGKKDGMAPAIKELNAKCLACHDVFRMAP